VHRRLGNLNKIAVSSRRPSVDPVPRSVVKSSLARDLNGVSGALSERMAISPVGPMI